MQLAVITVRMDRKSHHLVGEKISKGGDMKKDHRWREKIFLTKNRIVKAFTVVAVRR